MTQPSPSSPKVVTAAGVNWGSLVRRWSSTCFLMTYRTGLYVWNFFLRAVSIAAAGLSLMALLSYPLVRRSQVRLASAARLVLDKEWVMVASTRSSSGPWLS